VTPIGGGSHFQHYSILTQVAAAILSGYCYCHQQIALFAAAAAAATTTTTASAATVDQRVILYFNIYTSTTIASAYPTWCRVAVVARVLVCIRGCHAEPLFDIEWERIHIQSRVDDGLVR
jgi:hypothetical protein